MLIDDFQLRFGQNKHRLPSKGGSSCLEKVHQTMESTGTTPQKHDVSQHLVYIYINTHIHTDVSPIELIDDWETYHTMIYGMLVCE